MVVIGSGPGGYTAAFRAADLGLKTVLIERYDTLGGVCLNVGCIPSKALLHAARVVAEAEEMAEHGIRFGKPKVDLDALRVVEAVGRRQADRRAGRARQAAQGRGDHRRGLVHRAQHVVGRGPHDRRSTTASSRPGRRRPRFPACPTTTRVFDSTGALELASVPKRLLVVGCGIIGLEMATVYDALGSKVTMVELLDQLIPGCDPDLVQAAAEADLRRATRRSTCGTKVESVEAAEKRLR